MSRGLRCGLRSGVVPAVLGQFVSHGTRTAAFEGTLMALAALGTGAGNSSALQWQARLKLHTLQQSQASALSILQQ